MMKKKQSFEEALKTLGEIVTQLEEGDIPLEKSLELFENGVKLARRCQKQLEEAERRIEMLVEDSEGKPVLEELPEEEPGNSAD